MKFRKVLPASFKEILILFIVLSFSFQGVFARKMEPLKYSSLNDSIERIPLAGNTWASNKNQDGLISEQGIKGWSEQRTYFTTYFRLSKPGIINLWINLKVPEGKAKIKLVIRGKGKTIAAESRDFRDYDAGKWVIKDTGYIALQIVGIHKSGAEYADISDIKVSGVPITGQTSFVKNNDGNFFYWGRRGPSVHLNYELPLGHDIEWFYNEVTVPAGNDIIGSYYMAEGFSDGYFGIQVNSPTERRILFSVWSPFQSDDPKKVPEDKKIQLLKKGKDVHSGEFGNEGSGGQCYLRYSWKTETTYKFLINARPDNTDHTIYTAYFYDPEKKGWLLIASFGRPHTHSYLKRLHSFLENFSPENGNVERDVLFGNQWIMDSNGKWIELNKAFFTGDNTAAKGYRKDYAGGVFKNKFFLRNCGFFNNYSPLNTKYERDLHRMLPVINFDKLP